MKRGGAQNQVDLSKQSHPQTGNHGEKGKSVLYLQTPATPEIPPYHPWNEDGEACLAMPKLVEDRGKSTVMQALHRATGQAGIQGLSMYQASLSQC